MQNYEIAGYHLPEGEFNLDDNHSYVESFLPLGEIATKVYHPDKADSSESELLKKACESIGIDIDGANTIIEIRQTASNQYKSETFGYLSGYEYAMELPAKNPLGKATLNLFRVYGIAVSPNFQRQGAAQILFNELTEMLPIDAIIGETNNPQVVLARLKVAQRSSENWSIVWGNNFLGQNLDQSSDLKIEYVRKILYMETRRQRDLEVLEGCADPLMEDLFLQYGLLNAPDFVNKVEVDEELLNLLPHELQHTYFTIKTAEYKVYGGSKGAFQAPIYSIRNKVTS